MKRLQTNAGLRLISELVAFGCAFRRRNFEIRRLLAAGFACLLARDLLAQVPTNPAVDAEQHIAVYDVTFLDTLDGDLTDVTLGRAFDRRIPAEPEVGVNLNGGERSVKVVVKPHYVASSLNFKTVPPGIANPGELVPENGNFLLGVSVTHSGETLLREEDLPSKSLRVSAFPELTEPYRAIAVHLLNDTAGHSTEVSLLQVGPIFTVADTIWKNQVNIHFARTTTNAIQIPGNFGDSLKSINSDPDPGALSIESVVNEIESTQASADIHINFVHDVTSSLTGEPVSGLTLVNLNTGVVHIFMSNRSPDKSRDVAHEIGHAIGLPAGFTINGVLLSDYNESNEPPNRRYELMFNGISDAGTTIIPRQGQVINPID